jgi:vacuolar-type H+-ATPase subunit C/Vma6
MFQDITTLLLNPKAFKDTIDLFVERYKGKNISVVAGKKNKKQNSQERVKDPISAFILFFSLANFRSV